MAALSGSQIYINTLWESMKMENSPEFMGLTTSNKIQVIKNGFYWFYQMPDIGMDKYGIAVGHDAKLGTTGVATCFAICLRGRTAENEPVLGLCHASPEHASPDHDIESIVNNLKNKMRSQGCVSDVEVCIVGGCLETEDNPRGTFLEEANILNLAKQMNVQAVRFNLPGYEQNVNVVLTPDQIYASKSQLFKGLNADNDPDCEGDGFDLLDLNAEESESDDDVSMGNSDETTAMSFNKTSPEADTSA